MSDPSIIVRASSWATMFRCAYSWEGTHLLGMSMPSSPRATLGVGIHRSAAVFDQGRIDGSGVTIMDAVGALIDTIYKPTFDVDWSTDPTLTQHEAEVIGRTLHGRYCAEISPQFTYVAVERETTPLDIECGSGVVVRVTGTMDRSRSRIGAAGGKGIVDLKSGGRAVSKGVAVTKGHRAQVGTYELLEEHTTGEPVTEPAEIVGLKTKGKPEVAVGEIRNAKELLVGTPTMRGLIEYAADMFRTGLFPPNSHGWHCDRRYCARWNVCSYKDE